MRKRDLARRLVSVTLAVAMMMPAFACVAEAAVATWLSPAPGQKIVARHVEVSVGYNTESALKVTRLELWIDGNLYEKKVLVRPESRGVCSFWWDTMKSGKGSHDLVVRIYAGNELVSTVSGTGTVGNGGYDLRPPTVRFTNVKSGDVLKGKATIQMAASDDSGEPPMVSMLVDSALKLLSNRPPYVCDLDTTEYPDGSHELRSVAYDSAGNKSDPAIAKVEFRNKQERPVVVEMSIAPATRATASSEDDGVGELLPPVALGKSEPGAARAAEPSAKAVETAPEARPVAPTREHKLSGVPPISVSGVKPPSARTDDGVPKQVRAAESFRPAAPVVSQLMPEIHAAAQRPDYPAGVIDPVVPRELPIASEVPAGLELQAGAPQLRNSDNMAGVPAGIAAQPAVTSMGEPCYPEAAAVLSSPQARSQTVAISPHIRNVSTPRTPGNPAVALPAGSKVSHTAVQPRSVPQVSVRAGHAVVPARSTDTAVAAALPRPVKVAMLPTIRGGMPDSAGHGTVSVPPPARKDTRARIEKQTIPMSGSVRLRDVFNQLGGVLFWDPVTHTVTGYLGSMILEVRIGSPVVKVNGQVFKVDRAPIVANGRTIIDAGILHRACALAGLI